jgi:hypothetical protein
MSTVLEAQDLVVASWNPWMQDEDVVRDKWGNFKGSVTFNEYKSEPVDATFKTEPKVGDKKYGEIVEYQTKSGKTRLKFQRVDKPQEQQVTSKSPSGYQKSPEERDGIFRCNALTNAVVYAASVTPKPNTDAVLDCADKFYVWLKNGKEAPPISFEDGTPLPADEEIEPMPEDFLQ